MAVLLAGGAYVPVDADDPDERARLVFGEAAVVAVIGADLAVEARSVGAVPRPREDPSPDDDAWVIFTSGSTGTPKGVAVTHRNAAAFVDAESRLFLQAAPIAPGDRVMAGLSVAFDASCEEMWLAWRYGACLVPAPRALVRSGMDVGPWLAANEITVVSTVPTLVALWPEDSLDRVRLLILGGEAVPPELVGRLVRDGPRGLEHLRADRGDRGRVRRPAHRGRPGADRAAAGRLGPRGRRRRPERGRAGRAGRADHRRRRPGPLPRPRRRTPRSTRRCRASGGSAPTAAATSSCTTRRACCSPGRADDQIKIGGRRIELGEIDSALLGLPGVVGAAAAVRRTAAGNQLLVGYVTVDERFDSTDAMARLRSAMPAPMVPRLATVDSIPTRTSGKVDRDALPVAPPRGRGARRGQRAATAPPPGSPSCGSRCSGATVTQPEGRLLRPRWRQPDRGADGLPAPGEVPRGGGRRHLRPPHRRRPRRLRRLAAPASDNVTERAVPPTPIKTQAGQIVAITLLRALAAPRWLVWLLAATNVVAERVRRRLAPDRALVDVARRSGWSSSRRPAGCSWPPAAPGCSCAG